MQCSPRPVPPVPPRPGSPPSSVYGVGMFPGMALTNDGSVVRDTHHYYPATPLGPDRPPLSLPSHPAAVVAPSHPNGRTAGRTGGRAGMRGWQGREEGGRSARHLIGASPGRHGNGLNIPPAAGVGRTVGGGDNFICRRARSRPEPYELSAMSAV